MSSDEETDCVIVSTHLKLQRMTDGTSDLEFTGRRYTQKKQDNKFTENHECGKVNFHKQPLMKTKSVPTHRGRRDDRFSYIICRQWVSFGGVSAWQRFLTKIWKQFKIGHVVSSKDTA